MKKILVFFIISIITIITQGEFVKYESISLNNKIDKEYKFNLRINKKKVIKRKDVDFISCKFDVNSKGEIYLGLYSEPSILKFLPEKKEYIKIENEIIPDYYSGGVTVVYLRVLPNDKVIVKSLDGIAILNNDKLEKFYEFPGTSVDDWAYDIVKKKKRSEIYFNPPITNDLHTDVVYIEKTKDGLIEFNQKTVYYYKIIGNNFYGDYKTIYEKKEKCKYSSDIILKSNSNKLYKVIWDNKERLLKILDVEKGTIKILDNYKYTATYDIDMIDDNFYILYENYDSEDSNRKDLKILKMDKNFNIIYDFSVMKQKYFYIPELKVKKINGKIFIYIKTKESIKILYEN
ncbi:hypothetical protein OSSY52_11150 [Tepiditoga spiralis]|uniref:Uncharacterized protein n=1 Tax=Tepiditoga spiralis TaxID=2108365 RepID=A0A7G1G731_9BACT|nr:hypothetical protein [Tepiditoga spiralis]BBE29898.1 hypothetical protein OSSY52_00390 [Tepiditoga spiralis]BBE30974.1 hypothetical protein OSSY52_11150 [Tepiditoga spiralis]